MLRHPEEKKNNKKEKKKKEMWFSVLFCITMVRGGGDQP